ncbi:MAG: 2'-5' RNA ligase family protein [Leptolyngbya sp. SIO4C1]|nr:2'-5' RNA ligase family protein [Leptolyngbya sp. SIO4C1]
MESYKEAELLRFFIALVPPPPVQDYANQVKQYFAERYRSRKALNSPPHITLQPPFKWPASQAEALAHGLASFAAGQRPLPVWLDGFAAFAPRVIYINVVKSAELMAIKPALIDFMAAEFDIVDKQDRNRSFKPHLTVAFRDLKPAAFRQAWPEFEHKAVQFDFVAAQLTLLRHNGQRWVIEQQPALGQSR